MVIALHAVPSFSQEDPFFGETKTNYLETDEEINQYIEDLAKENPILVHISENSPFGRQLSSDDGRRRRNMEHTGAV